MLSLFSDACIWWKITRRHGISCSISKNQIQSLWMQILHKELKWLQDSSVEHLGLEAPFPCQWCLISAPDWMSTPLKFHFQEPVPQFKVFIVWLAWWSIAAYLLVIGKKMTIIKGKLFSWSDDKGNWNLFLDVSILTWASLWGQRMEQRRVTMWASVTQTVCGQLQPGEKTWCTRK